MHDLFTVYATPGLVRLAGHELLTTRKYQPRLTSHHLNRTVQYSYLTVYIIRPSQAPSPRRITSAAPVIDRAA